MKIVSMILAVLGFIGLIWGWWFLNQGELSGVYEWGVITSISLIMLTTSLVFGTLVYLKKRFSIVKKNQITNELIDS